MKGEGGSVRGGGGLEEGEPVLLQPALGEGVCGPGGSWASYCLLAAHTFTLLQWLMAASGKVL